jgi:hypothetical protein
VPALVVGTPEGCRIDVRLDGKAAKWAFVLIVDDACWMKLLERNRSIARH